MPTHPDLPVKPEDVEPGLSPAEFKLAFRNHPAGVAVITADDGSGPVGLTASSVFSVSAEPPLFVFSLSSASSAAPVLGKVDTLVIHLLGADQLAIAQRFATSGIDRFADPGSWSRLETGEPYLVDAPVRVRSRVVERLEMKVGGSTVIACHALGGVIAPQEGAAPLVYHDRAWHHLGAHSRLPA
nr:flavin reductase family protein [Streptomyces mangrovisoli]